MNNQQYPNYQMISGNFYPVGSAIMMRDQDNGKLQVTIMNAPEQAGAADLTNRATIELMQHLRQLQNIFMDLQKYQNVKN